MRLPLVEQEAVNFPQLLLRRCAAQWLEEQQQLAEEEDQLALALVHILVPECILQTRSGV